MGASEPSGRWRLQPSPAAAFVLQAALWVVLLFALLRLPWVERNLLLPFAALQGRLGCGLFGTSAPAGFVGLSCTGADPMALTLGAILAFPSPWKRRLAGAAIGLGMILALNTVRIGHLSLFLERPETLRLFHIYIWPALMIVAAAGWVFVWMSRSTRSPRRSDEGAAASSPGPRHRLAVSFLGWTALLVALFYVASGWIFRSAAVLELARWATVAAGTAMNALGLEAEVSGNRLVASGRIWVVTQSCVATPLVPVYLAAVLAVPMGAARRALALLAALPLFLLLGTARLLVLALPAALVGSHLVAVHAFYQMLAALVIVLLAGLRGGGSATGRRRRTALGAATRAVGGGVLAFALALLAARALLRPLLDRLAGAVHLGHAWSDPQGALLLLPPFQIGLLVALWLALDRPLVDRGLAAALAMLAASQLLVVAGLGEMASHLGVAAPIAAIRALALGVPLLLVWLLARRRETTRGAPASAAAASRA